MDRHLTDDFLASAFARKLSPAQCQKLYYACLEVLERSGVRLYDDEALGLMRRAGLAVEEGNRVHIPAGLVEKALSTVPKRLVIYDRLGRPAMRLEGRRAYFGAGSECLNIIDHRTNERRPPTLKDVREGVTVADALPNVSFVMSMFTPHEEPADLVNQLQMEIMLSHSTKPMVFIGADFPSCLDAVEMAEAVAGGPEEFRRRPFAVCYVNVTTCLRHNQESLQRLLYMSAKGLPVIYVPSGQGGTTAPITLAGTMLFPLAGGLAGLVLSQLKREGAPFIFPGWAGSMLDMKTTIQPYADPEKRGGAIDFAHFLGLPMFGLGGATDSKAVDEQAAAEVALTMLTDALMGGHMIHDLGYLESGQAFSLALMTICDELLSWIRAFMKGVAMTEEDLALDLIAAQGPDGQYLSCEHTTRNYRGRWYPALLDRGNRKQWLAKGGLTLAQRAAQRVDQILESHRPEPLEPAAAKAVGAIVARARARARA
jgi:trimethylamine--corrinoid protein Co-methyltransferase